MIAPSVAGPASGGLPRPSKLPQSIGRDGLQIVGLHDHWQVYELHLAQVTLARRVRLRRPVRPAQKGTPPRGSCRGQ